jgi:hypothetical protein
LLSVPIKGNPIKADEILELVPSSADRGAVGRMRFATAQTKEFLSQISINITSTSVILQFTISTHPTADDAVQLMMV